MNKEKNKIDDDRSLNQSKIENNGFDTITIKKR